MGGEELSSGIAFVMFSQALGPTVVLTLCNLIFESSLRGQITRHAPRANATAIIDAGATGFRSVVPPADLPGVLVAYSNSIDRVFYLVAALAAACGFVLWGMGWHDVREKEGDSTETVVERKNN